MPRSFALCDQMEAFIDAQVASGQYQTADEAVRDALNLLHDQTKLGAMGEAELRRLAEEGRASGLSSEDGTAFLDRLVEGYRGMIRQGEA
jgi:putative addiction module CopG family antidote